MNRNSIIKYTIKLGQVNTTIWQENEKVKQSGNPDFPEYIAEWKSSKEAKAYILGMVRFAEIINEQTYI